MTNTQKYKYEATQEQINDLGSIIADIPFKYGAALFNKINEFKQIPVEAIKKEVVEKK